MSSIERQQPFTTMNQEFLIQSPSKHIPLGTCAAVRSRIDGIFPGVSWVVEPSMLELMQKTADDLRRQGWSEELIERSQFENSYGHVCCGEFEFHFSTLDREPLFCFAIEVEGQGCPRSKIEELCRANEWLAVEVHEHVLPSSEAASAPSSETGKGAGELSIEAVLARWTKLLADIRETQDLSLREREKLLAELHCFSGASDVIVVNALLELCANVFGREAEHLSINLAQRDDLPTLCFPALCDALSHCCKSKAEGLAYATSFLMTQPVEHLPGLLSHLEVFDAGDELLEWIEVDFQTWESLIPSQVGKLAARSAVKWERLSRWLNSGTSLATIALDVILEQDAQGSLEVELEELKFYLDALAALDDSPQVQVRLLKLQDRLSS